MRRGLFSAVGIGVVGALAAVVLPAGAALADSTVVVRGLGFAPDSRTNLAIVGCDGLFSAGDAPVATYLSLSPDGPAGTRALKYQLGDGVAVGSQHRVTSMTAASAAGLSVLAPDGTTGVAYAAYQDPEDTDHLWIGRSGLAVRSGGWQAVDATGLTYRWVRYDATTLEPAPEETAPETAPPAGPSRVRAFAAEHGGDGQGFFAIGLGCDGHAFKIDALRTGTPGDVTTYDLEGFTSAAGITGSATRVTAGDPLTLRGSVTSDVAGPLVPGLLVLEARPFGAAGFSPVPLGADGATGSGGQVTVHPSARTVYRWKFVGTPSAEESVSRPFAVDVASAVTATSETATTGNARRPATRGSGAVGVVGAVAPARAGVRATLWRVGPGGPSKVASSVTGKDGSYRIGVPDAEVGPWRYFVTVPAGDGNLAGQSATQRLEPAGR